MELVNISANDLSHLIKKALKSVLKESGHSEEVITEKKWLTQGEARKLTGFSPAKLQRLRSNGSLPFSKVGGKILYNYTDLDSLISSHKQSGTA